MHYCYGNYLASHLTDPDYSSVLSDLLKLKVGQLVGEIANSGCTGDPVIIKNYVKEFGWPKSLKFTAGVIDVKSPFVETPETVNQKMHNISDIDDIDRKESLVTRTAGFKLFPGLEMSLKV